MTDLLKRLRGGAHLNQPTILAGVAHDERCLEAADEIEMLRDALRNCMGRLDTPIARRRLGLDPSADWLADARECNQKWSTSDAD